MSLGIERELSPHFAQAIEYALFPPVHERIVPLFGAMTRIPFGQRHGDLLLLQEVLPFPLPSELATVWSTREFSTARQAADGHSTFVLDDGHEEVSIVGLESRITEMVLVRLQLDFDITTVQRTGDGKVKVFFPGLMAVHEKNTWSRRPYGREMSWPILAAYESTVGQTLLDIALHILSPANVGATLVWQIQQGLNDSYVFDDSKATEVAGLSVEAPMCGQILRGLCAQNDRAVMVDGAGQIIKYGVGLQWNHSDQVSIEGGTRHNSAINASRLATGSMIFVVSSDGPVSVFMDGRKIASFTEGQYTQVCPRCSGSGEGARIATTGQLRLPGIYGRPGLSSTDPTGSCSACKGIGRVWERASIFR